MNWELFNLVPQGVFVIDSSLSVVHWNVLMSSWSGLHPSDVVGKNLLQLYPRLDNFKFIGRIEETITTGTPSHFSSLIHKYLIPCRANRSLLSSDNQYALHETTVTQYSFDNKNYGIFTIVDVTENFFRIQELKRLAKVKDDFLAVCSHDLKAPLNSILGFADLLLEEPDIVSNHLMEVQQIQKSGELLLSIINSLLTLTEISVQSHQRPKEKIILSDIVNSSILSLQGLTQKKHLKVTLHTEVTDGGLLMGRALDLERAINNLFSNAIKFTPDGGNIEFRINSEKNLLLLEITDSGVGIESSKIPILFKAFSGVSTAGTSGERGTGLGLSIVKEVIDQHLGKIQVNSQIGKGTTIQIQFPRLN